MARDGPAVARNLTGEVGVGGEELEGGPGAPESRIDMGTSIIAMSMVFDKGEVDAGLLATS